MKKEKLMPIVTIVLAVLCVAGFVTYGISRSMLLDTKEKVNNLKLNVKELKLLMMRLSQPL